MTAEVAVARDRDGPCNDFDGGSSRFVKQALLFAHDRAPYLALSIAHKRILHRHSELKRGGAVARRRTPIDRQRHEFRLGHSASPRYGGSKLGRFLRYQV